VIPILECATAYTDSPHSNTAESKSLLQFETGIGRDELDLYMKRAVSFSGIQFLIVTDLHARAQDKGRLRALLGLLTANRSSLIAFSWKINLFVS
jgi:hypothetical protein